MSDYTKRDILVGLKEYLYNNGVYVQEDVKIEECPQNLRHACAQGGISMLQKNSFRVEQPSGECVVVDYYVCKECGKLFIVKEEV